VNAIVHPSRRVTGAVSVPGDKSVSHRAALLGAVATGVTEVHGWLEAEDCLATLRAVSALGGDATRKGPGHYVIHGAGLTGLGEPENVIDCGNSGTTARLLSGILAGQPFATILTGDDSLRRRPMERILEPLARMGARFIARGGRAGGRRLPLAIQGSRPLVPIRHAPSVASAQVKSAILLAGLWASGPVTVEEPAQSRDHTERMLAAFGADVVVDGHTVTLVPGREPTGRVVRVPGDISSAAFFLVAGLLADVGTVTVQGVGVNPTRTGVLDILRAMGADLDVGAMQGDGEPIADLAAKAGDLRGTSIAGSLVPRAIDELPILAVAAARAEGVTEVRDAAELRVKESDRIRSLTTELTKLGVEIEERPDGFRIVGGGRRPFRAARVRSWGDHRLAMALIVAGLAADGPSVVEDIDCIATSYPDFVATCRCLAGEACVELDGP
jgi:3-phosphoshikimate 1-carboxyvinyltransferase